MYTVGIIDSLKFDYCLCSTCMGRQNRFIIDLKTDFFVQNERYDEALHLWNDVPLHGRKMPHTNKIIMDILRKKYGDSIDSHLSFEIKEDKNWTHVTILVDDEYLTEMNIVIGGICESKEECLSKIDFLQGLY